MDDISTAQKILGIKQAVAAGQLDDSTAQQLMDEQGLEAPIDPMAVPPESLQANPPDALAAPASDFVLPPVAPPEAIPALRRANEIEAQSGLSSLAPGGPGPLVQGIMQPVGPQEPAVDVPEIPQEEIAAAMAPTIQPTMEQQTAAHEAVVVPTQEAIAEHRATIQAQKDLQKEFADQKAAYEAQEKAIKEDIAAKDDFVRVKSLPEIMSQGSFGEKLSASIAVLLGGYAQGLTGAKSNPVLDFLDKQLDAQAQRDKLSSENKLALKKSLLDVAQLKMQSLANKSQDLYHKQALEQQYAALEVEKQKISGEQAIKAAEALEKKDKNRRSAEAELGAVITDPNVLSDEQRKRLVILPDGTSKLAKVGADQVDASAKRRVPIENAISAMDRIRTLAVGLNRITDLTARAKIGTEIKALAGALREPIVGPGAMTEDEYKRILATTGDPTELLAFPSLQKAKMDQLYKKMNSDLTAEYKRIGIELPKTREDQIVENLKKKGYSEAAIRKALGR